MAKIEKGIKVIDSYLKSDQSEIQKILQLPRALEELSKGMIQDLLRMFETSNKQIKLVKEFCKQSENEKLKVQETLEQVQE